MKTTALIVLALFIISSGGAVADNISLKFKYVNINFYGDNASIHMVLNNSKSITIQFEKIYAGTPIGHDIFPQTWIGDIGKMDITKESGEDKVMGKYIHVKMETSTVLHSMIGFRKDYPIDITLDFFISSKGYHKNSFFVDNSTLRYDLRMKTECPANVIIIQERIKMNGESMGALIQSDHNWKEMKKTYEKLPLNITGKIGEVGFGKEDEIDYRLMWSTEYMNSTFYTYFDGNFDIFFAYSNNGSIIDDPYIKTPVPILTPGNIPEVVKETVNYLMEHALSIAIGVGISSFIIAIPRFRRRKL